MGPDDLYSLFAGITPFPGTSLARVDLGIYVFFFQDKGDHFLKNVVICIC